jgi:hypothetical protein
MSKGAKTMTDVIMKIIFVGAALGLGIMLLSVGIRELVLQKRTLDGVMPVDAVIVSAEVVKSTSPDMDRRLLRNDSTTSYSPEVRFRYTLADMTYESEMLRPTIIVRGYASESAAKEEIQTFSPGAVVTAFVNPEYPSRGFLIAERSAAPAVFITVGIILLPIAGVLFRYL